MRQAHPTSVTALAHAADDAAFQKAWAEASASTMMKSEVIESLTSAARSKHWWIQKFSAGSGKRPDHEIERARSQFTALVKAVEKLKTLGA